VKYLGLVLLIALSACGEARQASPQVIDSEFQEYVSNFEDTFGIVARSNIVFGTLKDKRIGQCDWVTKPNDFLNVITIDKAFWDSANYWQREQVIFHELGHCELGIFEHDDTRDENYRHKSLMATRAIDWWVYEYFREEYIQDLKGKMK